MKLIWFLIWSLLVGGTIFGVTYYFGILQSLTAQVLVVNTKFLGYINVEYRILFAFFIFAIVWGFVDGFRK